MQHIDLKMEVDLNSVLGVIACQLGIPGNVDLTRAIVTLQAGLRDAQNRQALMAERIDALEKRLAASAPSTSFEQRLFGDEQ